MDSRRLPSRYISLGILGQGGEGQVFRAEDTLRGTELALKVTSPQFSHWLRREFETLRQIQHENLVRVLDWGLTEDDEVFYTMELVLGTDWGRLMGRPQPQEQVERVLSSVLKGLAHLHCHGEIHRDLKPGNVLLGHDGGVKLADVGMGGTDKSLSGTPGYSAPELWQGAQPTTRSDIYSLGVMAYEALTGRHPFAGKTVREVVSGQLEGWVPSFTAQGVRVAPGLERGVMRALERDPTLRPQTADELMELLGVQDRIGSILGGRFVARTSELQSVDSLIKSSDPNAPTLVWVSGESGIGKTALIDEITSRATGAGIRVAQVIDLNDIGSFRSPASPTFSESQRVWALAQSGPVLYVTDVAEDELGTNAGGIRVLARHLHAIAGEQGTGSKVHLICENHGQVQATEQFECVLSLSPLTTDETGLFLKGYLGTVDLQPEILKWAGSETGGMPGRLSSLVDELIGRKLLQRNAGRWHFRQHEDLPSIERLLGRGKWKHSWDRLTSDDQSIVALLAIMPRGLGKDVLATVVSDVTGHIESLIARGWLRVASGRVQPASGEIRRVALGASRATTVAVELALLRLEPGTITREELAWLKVRNLATTEALEEGLWAAREAKSRGDLRATVERAKACLRIADLLNDTARSQEVAFTLAEALHLLGRSQNAIEVLAKYRQAPTAAWEVLLGVCKLSLGALEDARTHLAQAVLLAERSGSSAMFFRGHAELAELDWRHGDEKSREAAIRRIRGALGQEPGLTANPVERTALTYQLGAALIVTGKREEALVVLQDALATASEDYWVMRLRNALATAQYYVGEFESALKNMEEAWRRSERGEFDLFKARIFSLRASIHYGTGRFTEALDSHRLAALWARRNGQEFEYVVARTDEAVNLMCLGQYEGALEAASEAAMVAERIGNEYRYMRNLETETLCHLLLGDNATAQEVLEGLVKRSAVFGHSAMAPRVLQLQGMLAEATGDIELAVSRLRDAESMLLKSRDWEDLPAVQIELQWVRAKDDAKTAAVELRRLLSDVARAGALTVQLRGALILAEVLLAGEIDDRDYRECLFTALGRASEAGARDDEWKLNAVLGELCLRAGDGKAAISRFGQALRGFRSIADGLTPDYRRFYTQTRHAIRLLSRISGPTTPGDSSARARS